MDRSLLLDGKQWRSKMASAAATNFQRTSGHLHGTYYLLSAKLEVSDTASSNTFADLTCQIRDPLFNVLDTAEYLSYSVSGGFLAPLALQAAVQSASGGNAVTYFLGCVLPQPGDPSVAVYLVRFSATQVGGIN